MIRIDLTAATPLAEQVRLALRRAIAEGEVAPGDELPSVRQLAGDLSINLNTVARAYRELEREGLVVSHRGRGTVVASLKSKSRVPRKELRGRMRDLCADALLSGYLRGDLEQWFHKEMKRGSW